MHSFKEFNIKPTQNGFLGDKIKIDRILNQEITVEDFKIGPSKFKDAKCLHLQIEFASNKRVVFTAAKSLIEQIEQVPRSGFPFKTTIIRENERFEFT